MGSAESVREWVGGRLTLPARIEAMGDRRAEMSLWVELPDLQVVGQVLEAACARALRAVKHTLHQRAREEPPAPVVQTDRRRGGARPPVITTRAARHG